MTIGTRGIERSFRRLRRRSLHHSLAAKLAGSRLRLVLVAGFGVVFWLLLFGLFWEGFSFLGRHQLISGPLVELLFGLFFVSLLAMLVFSMGIILYAGLFASEEAAFLLVTPAPADLVYAFKFQEALFYSCWGFMLLASPMVSAYGLSASAPWQFYPVALVYFVAFALVPGSAGALGCLLLLHYFPRRRRELVVAAAALFLALGGVVAWNTWTRTQGDPLTRAWWSSLLEQLEISNLPFLPSRWISRGLLAASYPDGAADAAFYLLVLLSNGLFLYLLSALAYRWLYRQTYNRVQSHPLRTRRWSGGWLLAVVPRLGAARAGPLRVLLIKDLRTFLRDPLQWSQVVIFTGLLVFYLVYLGRMNYYTDSPYWRNLIGFFNLAVTALILSTYTSRFIFPLLSLEGQKFWILGLAPVGREAILWSKFAFSSGGAVLVTVLLTGFGAWMLKLDGTLALVHLVTVLVLSFGLSGIAVGLGARFAELHQPDPSKIAAGFGGTLNLVASLLFIVVVVTTMALPCHLYSVTLAIERGTAGVDFAGQNQWGISREAFQGWMALSVSASLLVGGLTTYLSMRLGIRAFRDREF